VISATQVVVIGAGQSGLAAGYHLRRLGPDFLILDAQSTSGVAWQQEPNPKPARTRPSRLCPYALRLTRATAL
jgi:cation diffusion facilitator CzcD-associated flavoprotein CzcO